MTHTVRNVQTQRNELYGWEKAQRTEDSQMMIEGEKLHKEGREGGTYKLVD